MCKIIFTENLWNSTFVFLKLYSKMYAVCNGYVSGCCHTCNGHVSGWCHTKLGSSYLLPGRINNR